jgi:hypothetical protein
LLAHERDPGDNQAVNDNGQTEREPTGNGGQEGLTGGVNEPDDTEYPYNGHAQSQDGEPEREDEAYESHYADAQEYPHTYEDGADSQEETDQVADANDEPELVLDANAIHEGPAEPESTEYPEHDELPEEDGVSGDVEAPSAVTPSTPAKENILPYAEFDLPSEALESVSAGESVQFNESEGGVLNVSLLLTYSCPPQNGRLPMLSFLVLVAITEMRKRSMISQVRCDPVNSCTT